VTNCIVFNQFIQEIKHPPTTLEPKEKQAEAKVVSEVVKDQRESLKESIQSVPRKASSI
jgi:hypothetical protein